MADGGEKEVANSFSTRKIRDKRFAHKRREVKVHSFRCRKRMKFIIATGIYPPEIGGPATVIPELVRTFRRHGHDVHVVTYGDASVKEDGVTRVSRRGSLPLRYLRFAYTLRCQFSSDMRVIGTDVFSSGIPMRLALIGFSSPLILRLGGEWCWEDAVTKHGLRVTMRTYWAKYSHNPSSLLKRILARWVITRAQRVLLMSSIMKEPIRVIAPAAIKRSIVIPNVVPECAVRRDSSGPHVPFRFFTVARFAPIKNMPFLARVLRTCVEQGIDLSCTFVGDGSERAEVQKILKDVHGMTFVGIVDHAEVARILSNADALLLPTLTDICPNGALEALQCGVPCIITSEHGLPDGVHGIMEVDPTDESAWIAAIRRIINPDVYLALRTSISLPTPTMTLADSCERL